MALDKIGDIAASDTILVALKDIVTQRAEAIAKLAQAEIDARNNIEREVAKIEAQIASERERIAKEKAKYDASVYDLSEFDRVFRQLDEHEANLYAQEAQAYADLERQITDARADVENDAGAAMRNLIENDYNSVLGDIAQRESSPVIFFYYRNVLGRDPDSKELTYWLDKAKTDLSPITPEEVTTYIKNLDEYAERTSWKELIIADVTTFFTQYLAADDAGKASMLAPLGLTLDDVTLSVIPAEAGIQSILDWLENQSLHFGDSAFKTLRELFGKEGVTKSFDEIGKDAVKIDILTGVINPNTTGDLVISMHAMKKVAETNGLTLYAERIDFEELKTQFAINDSIILHVNGDHYVVIKDINEDDGTVTYKDLSVGEAGQEITLSRAEFMEEWNGYVLSKNEIQTAQSDTVKYLNATQEKNIRGAGWWKKFWKGVTKVFQILAPIVAFVLIVSNPAGWALGPAIGYALLGLNVMIQTISFVARTGTLIDIVLSIGSAIAIGYSAANIAATNAITPAAKGALVQTKSLFNVMNNFVSSITTGIGKVLTLGAETGKIATAIGSKIVGLAVNFGSSIAFQGMKLDPTLSTIGSALFSGFALGMHIPRPLDHPFRDLLTTHSGNS